ncbi:MAG: hypothetical protein K2W97_03250 [Chthoniobacterales bacterium]|nr:hypothetical protein [Chthoniobacterales bacterium]
MAFFGFASKAESQQQSAQKKTWTESISNFFSGLFGGASKTSSAGSSLVGAKANLGDKANAGLREIPGQPTSSNGSSGRSVANSVRKQFGEHSTSPNSPQVKAGEALAGELRAVDTDDTTAVDAHEELMQSGGIAGILRKAILGGERKPTQTQARESSPRDSMTPGPGERGSFVSAPNKQPKSTSTQNSVLGDTGEALARRGGRVESVAKKTEDFRETASDFAALARKVKEQQQKQAGNWLPF